MKWRNITSKELSKIVQKLALESTQKQRSPHPVYWYCLDEQRVLRITLPNIHGGAGAVSTGFLKNIKDSLRLNNQEFEDLIACPLTAEKFEALIRLKLNI